MSVHDPRRLFAAAIRLPDEDISLAEAALLIAQEEYPDLDPIDYLTRIDSLACIARERIHEDMDPYEQLNRLSEFLFDDETFRR